ncbi:unnamed protein product [Tilletia controversa]|uniref:Uncharacterized protein n=1 Tax=Tilletia caries TaxID=13290 RepID=A0A177V862_9BASI|nr:hypothetical protein CF336_g8037 [Tilletia laevis]KAE8256277.1 hypothetical protein A4X03_0g5439 [Tilletia caries]CAD6912210.1 unnamed protein product [Tilletia controversa]CAD6893375.1 unnamed protein product [Tilletia caries]CAD6898316.1 unnamed protein product [Tilletia caries]
MTTPQDTAPVPGPPPAYGQNEVDDSASTLAPSPRASPEPEHPSYKWKMFAEATRDLIKEAGFVLSCARNLKLDVSIAGILKAHGLIIKAPTPQQTQAEREVWPERSSAYTDEMEWVCTMACIDDLVKAVLNFRTWNRRCQMDATIAGTLGLHGIDIHARNKIANISRPRPSEPDATHVMEVVEDGPLDMTA